MNFLRLAVSLALLAQCLFSQSYYASPRFRVSPKSDGSAVGEVQWYGLTGSNYLSFIAPNSVPSTLKWKLPTTDAVGALCSDGALNLYFGCAGGASGITTLNSLTAPVQSLSTGVTGTAPNWGTSGGNTHILNIPFASTGGVTAGLISNANFAAFTAKQDAISASGPITFVSNVVACATCVTGPGSSTVGYVPTWNNTGGTALAAGHQVSAGNTPSTIMIRDSSGNFAANVGLMAQILGQPSTAVTAAIIRRGTAGQTDPIQTWTDHSGTPLSSIDKDGHFTGRSATALALAANGANCSAGQAPLGVDASGAVEGCFTPAGGGNVSGSGTTVVGMIPAYTNTSATAIGPGYPLSYGTPWVADGVVRLDGGGNFFANTLQLDAYLFANTASTGLPAAQFRRHSAGYTGPLVSFVDNSGSEMTRIDYQGNFTGRAATATALAANGANCSAGQAPLGVDASGAAEGCFTPGGGTSLAIYNVKDAAYGAVGDGSNDDTSEVQAAITACQDSTRGGVVYFPPGTYGISSGLWHGNGATSGTGNPSTKAVCRFIGAGAGDDPVGTASANVSISTIKWIGSNPGSLTYMLTIDGPIFGTGIEHLRFDGNSNSNVVGIDLRHVNFSHFSDISVVQTGGGSGGSFAVKIWAQKTFDHFACYNTIENMRVRPYTNSVGSALWIGGNSTFGTACSINITGGYFNRDNNYTSGTNTATYGVLLDSSDNFHAVFTHFSNTGGNGARNGCSIGASPSAYAGAGSGVYPDSAHFYGVSSGGMCGQTGSSTRPFVVWGGECGAEGQGSCDYHNAFTGGGQRPISLSGESDAALKGVALMTQRNNGGSGTIYHQVLNNAGTSFWELKRGGVTGDGIEINGVNEIQFKNPSFTEAYLKVRPSASSSPGSCNSTNEGWFWVKAATSGVATTLTMCAANSAGVYDWRTVQTF